MQQFFTCSTGWDEAVRNHYKRQLANQLTEEKGFLSVDEIDFVKKATTPQESPANIAVGLEKRKIAKPGYF